MSARSRLWLALWLLLCVTLAYAGNLGHGFIGEDFEWLRQADLRSIADARAMVLSPVAGHYRPLVAATFVVDDLLTGLSPLGHGLINLVLACAAAVVIGMLAAAARLGFVGAVTAAAIWLFSPDTVGPATTAIAGRSQLLAALCGAAAGSAFLHRRAAGAALWTAAAVASHETMWPLPLVLASWLAADTWLSGTDVEGWPAADHRVHARPNGKANLLATVARRVWPAALAAGAVLLVGAVVVARDAAAAAAAAIPPAQVLTASGALGALFAAAIAAVTLILTLSGALRLDRDERRALIGGTLWLAPGLVHTLLGFVGLLSPALDAASLSVGAALVGAAAARAAARRVASPAQRARAAALILIPAVALPAVAAPLSWQRNAAGRAEAQLAAHVLQRLFTVLRDRPDIRRVELYQAIDERPSIGSAVGRGLDAAVELGVGRRLESRVALTEVSDPWPSPQAYTLRLTVAGDEIVAVAPPLER